MIPIGGQHITNDLAIGLKTDLDIAEIVKIEHADIRHSAKKTTVTVKKGSETHNFPFDDVVMIVEARVEELLEYVDKELAKIKKSRKLPGGIIITGGSAKLPGFDEFAKEKLQLPARVGKLQNIGGLADTVEDQSFTTVVGLMLLDMLLLPDLPPVHGKGSQNTRAIIDGLLGRLKR